MTFNGGIMITEITKLTPKLDLDKFKNITQENSLFFDIETTGLSAKSSFVYLIGCAYFEGSQWFLIQWFGKSKASESKIISAFIEFSKNYKTLISYNGLGFDIPFLKNKCNSLGIAHSFDHMKHIDLYKIIMPYKKFLKLNDLKQKSIEEFLSIYRTDSYDARQLIAIYFDNLQNPSDELLKALLLHNHDDIEGLLSILPIISYQYLFNGIFSIETIMINFDDFVNSKLENEIIFQLNLPFPVPKKLSYQFDSFYLIANQYTVKIKAEIFYGELKFFYKNYKDYYYLPAEDTAIHKSVASYVDRDFRIKSKASNCYRKKVSRFLLQYKELISPYFKTGYSDHRLYFELTDEILSDSDVIAEYIQHLFPHIQNKH